jgi:hypothetical protein
MAHNILRVQATRHGHPHHLRGGRRASGEAGSSQLDERTPPSLGLGPSGPPRKRWDNKALLLPGPASSGTRIPWSPCWRGDRPNGIPLELPDEIAQFLNLGKHLGWLLLAKIEHDAIDAEAD